MKYIVLFIVLFASTSALADKNKAQGMTCTHDNYTMALEKTQATYRSTISYTKGKTEVTENMVCKFNAKDSRLFRCKTSNSGKANMSVYSSILREIYADGQIDHIRVEWNLVDTGDDTFVIPSRIIFSVDACKPN